MLMERKPRCETALESIDAGLQAAAQITVEQGIVEAIIAGRMTREEGQQCLEAYERTFHGTPEMTPNGNE